MAPQVQVPAQSKSVLRTFAPAITIPAILIFLAYLVTGFNILRLSDASGEDFLSVPLYLSCGLLLLILQYQISKDRSRGHSLYLLITSGVAFAYIGYFLVRGQSAQITRNAAFYEVAELAALGVFIFDAIRRGQQLLQKEQAARPAANDSSAQDGQRVSGFWGGIVADLAGLALLFFFVAGVLRLLTDPGVSNLLGVCPASASSTSHCAYVNRTLPGFLSASQSITLNALLGAGAFIVGGLLLGLLAVNIPRRGQTGIPGPGLFRSLREFSGIAVKGVFDSLRLVLNPIIWLIPAACIALFVRTTEQYLTSSTSRQCVTLQHQNLFLALFSPIGACSTGSDYLFILLDIALVLLALLAVFVSVAVAETDFATLALTIEIYQVFGRRLILSLFIFAYVLGAINGFVWIAAFYRPTTPVPFHVGAPGIIALAAIVIISIVAVLRRRRPTPRAAVSVPAQGAGQRTVQDH